jgi:hypothetical protein
MLSLVLSSVLILTLLPERPLFPLAQAPFNASSFPYFVGTTVYHQDRDGTRHLGVGNTRFDPAESSRALPAHETNPDNWTLI